jgi:hypothetical protein
VTEASPPRPPTTRCHTCEFEDNDPEFFILFLKGRHTHTIGQPGIRHVNSNNTGAPHIPAQAASVVQTFAALCQFLDAVDSGMNPSYLTPNADNDRQQVLYHGVQQHYTNIFEASLQSYL